jgi:nifR3 family TIM-barrel protein
MPNPANTALQIANMRLDSPILLAPLAGYSDLAFRSTIRELGGIGIAFTEMIAPASLLQGKSRKLKPLLATNETDHPLGHQIYGSRKDHLCQGAQWLADHGARLIDINMGCPQRKISSHGAGAGLLRDPEQAISIAAAVVKSVTIPVTVKLRLGWDHDRLVAHEMIPGLEDAGVSAVTIHGRTRGQGYTGKADLTEIRRVVEAAKRVPIIGNGDVTSPDAARQMFTATHCAGIMIGRGALSNPWLIRDIWRSLNGLPLIPPPDRQERLTFAMTHFERMVALYGPSGATLLYRKWIPQYLRRLTRSRQHMVELLQIADADTMRAALASLLDNPKS